MWGSASAGSVQASASSLSTKSVTERAPSPYPVEVSTSQPSPIHVAGNFIQSSAVDEVFGKLSVSDDSGIN